MPLYKFFCYACKKSFSKVLSLVNSTKRAKCCARTAAARKWSSAVRLLRYHLQEERVTTPRKEAHMRFDRFSFGTIRIDGTTCEHDVVIDRGEVRKRKKGPSKQFSDAFGHTPLSIEEKIPWKCRQLVIGSGRTEGCR